MRGIRLRLTIRQYQPILLGAEGQLRQTTSLLQCVVRISGLGTVKYTLLGSILCCFVVIMCVSV